jgi:hypothetical protein
MPLQDTSSRRAAPQAPRSRRARSWLPRPRSFRTRPERAPHPLPSAPAKNGSMSSSESIPGKRNRDWIEIMPRPPANRTTHAACRERSPLAWAFAAPSFGLASARRFVSQAFGGGPPVPPLCLDQRVAPSGLTAFAHTDCGAARGCTLQRFRTGLRVNRRSVACLGRPLWPCEMVRFPDASAETAKCARGDAAGPRTTLPSTSNSLPWHPQ